MNMTTNKRLSKKDKLFNSRVDRIRSFGMDCIQVNMFKLGAIDKFAHKVCEDHVLGLADESFLTDTSCDEVLAAKVREYCLSPEIGGIASRLFS